MQTHALSLSDQISQANELMRDSGPITTEAKKLPEALQIYQSVVEHRQYAYLSYSMRLVIFIHLNELIKHLPDKKDDILKSLIKQFISELDNHFDQTRESDDIAPRIIAIIDSETDKSYFLALLEQFDALYVCARDRNWHPELTILSRKDITRLLLTHRLTYLNNLYCKSGETPDPVPLYQKLITLYSGYISEKILEKITANLNQLITQFPDYRKGILDMLEQAVKNKLPFLAFFVNEKEHCARLIKFLSDSFQLNWNSLQHLRRQKEALSWYDKKAEPQYIEESDFAQQKLEFIKNHSTDLSILFQVNQALIAVYPDEDKFIQTKMTVINKCEEIAKKLSLPFNLRDYLPSITAYARRFPTAENCLRVANLGSYEFRIDAANLLQKTDLNQAIHHYLLAVNDILQTKDIYRIVHVAKHILQFKKNNVANMSAEGRQKIDEAIYRTFKESDLFYHDAYYLESLKEQIDTLSFEQADQVFVGLNKKFGNFIGFLTIAENYYSRKLTEPKPHPDAIHRYTEYAAQVNAVKNHLTEISAEIKALSTNLYHSEMELPVGQQILQWIQNYVAMQKIAVQSTPFDALNKEVTKTLGDYLQNYTEKLSPTLDLAALLNTNGANEASIQIQNNLIDVVMKAVASFQFSHQYLKQSYLLSYNYVMFLSVASTLDAESHFYHFAEIARTAMTKLREKMQNELFNNVAFHFYKEKPGRKILIVNLNFSRLLGCPLALALDVIQKVSVKGTSRHALLACANLLVLAKNRDLVQEVEKTYLAQYLKYGYSYLLLLNSNEKDKNAEKLTLKTLETAVAKAKSYLNDRTTGKIYKKYHDLALWLSDYVNQADVAPPIVNPILFLWQKKATSAIKGSDIDNFKNGLLSMVSSPDDLKKQDGFQMTPLEQKKFFAALDNYVEAQRSNYSRKPKSADAPPLEEKQMPTPSAPVILAEVKTQDTKKEQAEGAASSRQKVQDAIEAHQYSVSAEWDPKQTKKPLLQTVAISEHKEPRAVTVVTTEKKLQPVTEEKSKPVILTPAQSISSVSLPVKIVSASTEKVTPEVTTLSLIETEPGCVNSISANIQITESKSGNLFISATLLSQLTCKISLAVYGCHLLLAHHGITPLIFSDSEIYLDAPEGCSVTAAPVTVAIHIGDKKKDDFRLIKTTVTATETTLATLELSFFSRSRKISSNTPLVSESWVKSLSQN